MLVHTVVTISVNSLDSQQIGSLVQNVKRCYHEGPGACMEAPVAEKCCKPKEERPWMKV